MLFFFGLFDYALRRRRFEMVLTTTPEQQREDRRVMEGDPAVLRQAVPGREVCAGDSADVLAGASLVLTGPAGLTLVLAGGPPPPRVVSVQAATKERLVSEYAVWPRRAMSLSLRLPTCDSAVPTRHRVGGRRQADDRVRRDLAGLVLTPFNRLPAEFLPGVALG